MKEAEEIKILPVTVGKMWQLLRHTHWHAMLSTAQIYAYK